MGMGVPSATGHSDSWDASGKGRMSCWEPQGPAMSVILSGNKQLDSELPPTPG